MSNADAEDLLRFLAASPTPYHAVAEVERRLTAAGATELDEALEFRLEPGSIAYVVRAGTTLAAVRMGTGSPVEHGFRMVGAHTDSPNLRVKPNPNLVAAGTAQLAVEPYGGVLLHTWLDRDLGLAGRAFVRTASGVEPRLVDLGRPLLRVPSLAIHLNRNVNTEGLVLNAQRNMPPLHGLATEPNGPGLAGLLGDLGGELLGFDLMLTDLQPPCFLGGSSEFVSSGRLDNLASCHAAISAFLSAEAGPATDVVVLFDHEEVGSRSAQGAQSSLLRDLLGRVLLAAGHAAPDALPRAMARSFLISADMAHALHPNYADRHEPGHAPLLGKGPVIKSNVNQSYATDGDSLSRFDALARRASVPTQRFVTRSDLGCGSTIGPMTAAALSVRTVDVGIPMLSMHSARELLASADVPAFIQVLRAFFGPV